MALLKFGVGEAIQPDRHIRVARKHGAAPFSGGCAPVRAVDGDEHGGGLCLAAPALEPAAQPRVYPERRPCQSTARERSCAGRSLSQGRPVSFQAAEASSAARPQWTRLAKYSSLIP